jgi:hypothetical protein
MFLSLMVLCSVWPVLKVAAADPASAGAAATTAAAAEKPTIFSEAKDVVVKLGVESGRPGDHGRDTRVFTISVTCADAKANFTWGCGGQTIITRSFAQKARIEVRDNEGLKQYVDGGSGKPIFAGDAPIDVVFGGQSHQVVALVMYDTPANRNVPGVIGLDAATMQQWEIDPRVPQITFRALGSVPEKRSKPLATIPLKEEDENLMVHVKVRGAEEDVVLMPQAAEFQASPALQKAWDLDPAASSGAAGSGRVLTFRGGVESLAFNEQIAETNFLVFLLGAENPNARSGVGQSILNRFVYSVDAQRKEMVLWERVTSSAATKAAGQK